MKLIILCIFMLPLSVFSKAMSTNSIHTKPRNHIAHEHGVGIIGIAFEGINGNMEFKISSESIFGFEYKANSSADKVVRDKVIFDLENQITEMVVFDSALSCKIKKEKIDIVSDMSNHSDLFASYVINCKKSPNGTEILFKFHNKFKKIKKLNVSIIVDSFQKSLTVDKSNSRLLLN